MDTRTTVRLVRWKVSFHFVLLGAITGCGKVQPSSPPPTVSVQSPQPVVAVGVEPHGPRGSISEGELYDPTRDPAVDVAAAIATAKASGKRVLVQVGGNWCGWCFRLHQYFSDQPAVAKALEDGFVVVLVNFSDDNKNQAFLGKYPRIIGYPHLFVLDSDGTLLHSQETSELEEGDSYNEAKVLAFLSDWKKSP